MRADILQRHPYLWAALGMVGGLLLSFGFSLMYPGLVSHPGSILRLPLLSWWKNLPLIFSRDFVAFTGGLFQPVGYALLALVHTLVPSDASFFWHLWLVGFHFLNALLVFSLVRFFTPRTGPALLAGLVFALHPLASIAAGQVVYFPYLLALTFLLASLRLYMAYDQRSGKGLSGGRIEKSEIRNPKSEMRKGLYGASVLLFLLSLMTCKAGAGFPLFFLAYEGLYRRRGLRVALVRFIPLGGALVVMIPFWLYWRPHPLLYQYLELSKGAGRYSFLSVVGASGLYLKGLLWGGDVPMVLHEAAERIFRVLHWKVLLWGTVDGALLAVAVWAVRKGYWAGLGGLWVFCGMVPFASTAWNGVEEYLSWIYLYFPIAGLALAIGGWADALLPPPCTPTEEQRSRGARGRPMRIFLVVAGCALVVLYGYRQRRLNRISRSERSYWEYVYRIRPTQGACLSLGKAYLRHGEVEKALEVLFSPYVAQLKDPCRSMSTYYAQHGDLLAAAVHLNMGGGEDTGLRFQNFEMARAILFYQAGALDYAEDALGRVLMAHPFRTDAVALLSEVWAVKGYMTAARRILLEDLRIAPSDPELLRATQRLGTSSLADTSHVIKPPDPSWLRYALQRIREGPVIREIVQASALHPKDPVLQIEAGICLVWEGNVDSALAKIDFATQQLSSCAYVWATKCWVEAQAGAYREALTTGQHALELDPRNAVIHGVLGLLYQKTAKRPEDLERAAWHYQKALESNPRNPAVHNNLGELLIRQGKPEEAAEHFRQALRVRPDYAEFHYNLGNVLIREGKFHEAIHSFEEALRLRPDFIEARSNLGVALLQEGRSQESEEQFRRILQVRPDQDKAWENLGAVFIRQGRFLEALELFRRWGTLVPDRPGAILSQAWLLATCPDADVRDGKKALKLAKQICRASGYRRPGALGVLAAAYAEEGRYEEAVRYAQRALWLATRGRKDKLVSQIEVQLKLYKSHRPYRMRPAESRPASHTE